MKTEENRLSNDLNGYSQVKDMIKKPISLLKNFNTDLTILSYKFKNIKQTPKQMKTS